MENPISGNQNNIHQINKLNESSCKKESTDKRSLRYGKPCPYCSKGIITYNTCLQLTCLKCGKTENGAFT